MLQKLMYACLPALLVCAPGVLAAEGGAEETPPQEQSEEVRQLNELIDTLTEAVSREKINIGTLSRDPFALQGANTGQQSREEDELARIKEELDRQRREEERRQREQAEQSRPPDKTEEQKRLELLTAANRVKKEVTVKVLEGHFDQAISRADTALEEWESDAQALQWLDTQHHELVRLKRAAERLQYRRGIQQAFDAQTVDVQGITWAPHRAVATINGHVLQEGDTVLQRSENAGRMQDLRGDAADEYAARPRVYRIEKQHIIFMFRGMRMRKPSAGAGATLHTAAK